MPEGLQRRLHGRGRARARAHGSARRTPLARALQKHLNTVKLLIVDEGRSRLSAPNCSSRCSASAMNVAPRWSQATCHSMNGLPYSARNGSKKIVVRSKLKRSAFLVKIDNEKYCSRHAKKENESRSHCFVSSPGNMRLGVTGQGHGYTGYTLSRDPLWESGQSPRKISIRRFVARLKQRALPLKSGCRKTRRPPCLGT
jgi:hypothetical protein